MLSIDTNSQVKSLFTNVDSNSEFEVILYYIILYNNG